MVENYWGDVWHVEDKDCFTVLYDKQPECFKSIDSAIKWPKKHGYSPELKDEKNPGDA